MSEKTLQQVGKEAARYYAGHNDLAGEWQNSKLDLNKLNSGFESNKKQVIEKIGANSPAEAEARLRGYMAEDQEIIDKQAKRAEGFAEDNAGQLHDLAVIEAHLGGVAINIEQPLEIGQRVEVHTPEQE